MNLNFVNGVIVKLYFDSSVLERMDAQKIKIEHGIIFL